jgi:hypothetical protein
MTTCGICLDAEGIPSCSRCAFVSCVDCTGQVESCAQCREPFQKCRFCNDHRLALSPVVCGRCESTVCSSCMQCSESDCVSHSTPSRRTPNRTCSMCNDRVRRRVCSCGFSVCRDCATRFNTCPSCDSPMLMTPYRRPRSSRTHAPRRVRRDPDIDNRQRAIVEHVARSLVWFFSSPNNMQ